MKKIIPLFALLICLGASAQTFVTNITVLQYSTQYVTVPVTASITDTNPIIGGPYASALAFLTTGSNWMFTTYGIESINDHKVGFGIGAGYRISDNVVTLLRGDYFDHSFWMPSLSIQLQAPIKLMQKVTVIPFTFGGVATPLGAGHEGTVVGLLGIGGAIRFDFIKSTGFWSKLDAVMDYELWQGMPEAQRKQIRVGLLYKL